MAITLVPQVSPSGELLVIGVQVSAGAPVANVTAVGATGPTVRVNGTARAVGPPVWADTSHEVPYVGYRFATPVLAGDAVDYTLPSAAITTASGSNAAVSAPAAVANFVGGYPDGFGGYSGFTPNRTMPVGMSFDPTGVTEIEATAVMKNMRVRLPVSWTKNDGGTTVYNPDDESLLDHWTAGTRLTKVFWNPTLSNGIELNTGQISYPIPEGRYTIVFDDVNANTADALQIWIVGKPTKCKGSDLATGPGTGLATTYNRTVSGNTVTVTYDLTYPSDPNLTYGYTMNLALWIKSTVGKWDQDGTISNFWIFGPYDTDCDRSNPYAVSNQMKTWFTTSNGNSPAAIRSATIGAANGLGNYQEPDDLPKISDFSWNVKKKTAYPIVAVRRYNVDPDDSSVAWSSPKLYHPLLGNRGSTGGIDATGPFLTIPKSDKGNYLNLFDSIGGAAIEFVCSVPHGLRSFDIINFSPGFLTGPRYVACGGGDNVELTGNVTVTSATVGGVTTWTATFTETKTFYNNDCLTFVDDTTGSAYKVIASPSPQTGTAFKITAYNGPSGTVTQATTTAAIDLQLAKAPVWVTSDTTFVGWTQSTFGVKYGTDIKSLSSTSEVPVICPALPINDGGTLSYEAWAHVAAQFPGAAIWILIQPHMSDACLEAIADQMAPIMLPNSVFVSELGLEHWNILGFDTFKALGTYANLLSFLDPLIPVNDYYTTPVSPVALSDSQVNVILSGHQHDVLQARFDTYGKGIKVFRFLGSQLGSTHTRGMINFACTLAPVPGTGPGATGGLQRKVPISGIGVAPYVDGPTPLTATSNGTWWNACSPAGGNWPVAAIHDWYQYWLKYNSKYRGYYESDIAFIKNYVTLSGLSAYGQVGNPLRPAYVTYEASVEKINPAPGAGLAHDLWYAPGFARTYDAYLQSLQDGSPYVSHSGFDLCCTLSFCGWGGLHQSMMWAIVNYWGQQSGDGMTNKFTTPQGGIPGDGKCYDHGNVSTKLPVLQNWIGAVQPSTNCFGALTKTDAGDAAAIAAAQVLATAMLATERHDAAAIVGSQTPHASIARTERPDIAAAGVGVAVSASMTAHERHDVLRIPRRRNRWYAGMGRPRRARAR